MQQARKAAFTAATVSAMNSHGTYGFFTRIRAIPRMLRDTFNGTYRGVSRGRVFGMFLAVLYLISPIDLVPEALLTVPGLVDDAAIAVWLLAAVLTSAEDYLAVTDPQPVPATATVIDSVAV